jgi:thymidylate kinase
MRIVPVYVWDKLPIPNKKDRLVGRSEGPVLRKVLERRGIKLRRPQERDSSFLERIVLDSQVLIVEGISGSGKDTFQTHLKNKLKGRDVYDYSEGEVLHSWKQLQIDGISQLRVKFMKLLVNYVRDIVSRDENAVFLFNRFHLSTYASTIIQQPQFEREYDEIINILRTLSVHIFILQLDTSEIEKRSLHPERSGAWKKFQQQIAAKGSFRDRLERQQSIILQTAKRQQIPYSVIELPYEPGFRDKQVRISKASTVHRAVRMNAAEAKISRKKRESSSNSIGG